MEYMETPLVSQAKAGFTDSSASRSYVRRMPNKTCAGRGFFDAARDPHG
jgi:hypothetical protein